MYMVSLAQNYTLKDIAIYIDSVLVCFLAMDKYNILSSVIFFIKHRGS